MFENPKWMDEFIQRRLDNLYQSIPKNVRVQNIRKEADQYFNGFKNSLDANQWTLLLQWEEQENFYTAIEKELFYRKGLDDGVQLILSFLCSKPDL